MSLSVETLYEQWERELAQLRREPDVALIASLESQAKAQGVDLLEFHAALTAAVFEEALHPRGHDGKFIELGGLIKLRNYKVQGKNGQTYDFNGSRGKVLGITPDPKAGPNSNLPPNIRVGVLRPDQSDDDQPSTVITVKPSNVEMAPEKARLPGGDGEDEGPAMMVIEPGAAEVPGGPTRMTITPEEADELAAEVIAGNPVDVNPPDIDDVIDRFADNDGPVDLTLLPSFAAMRESGTPRSEMPQIPAEQMEAFQARLRDAGVSYGPEIIDPQDLRATQSELDGNKVGGIMRATREGKLDLTSNPMWVSSDGHILDGHHRWAAAAAISSNCNPPQKDCVQIPIMRVGMPIRDLLAFANTFNDEVGVERLAFGQDRSTPEFGEAAAPTAPVAAAGTPLPQPDEDGIYRGITFATDEADGITDEDLANLPHGDGSLTPDPEDTEKAFGYQSEGATEEKGEDEGGNSSSPFQADGLIARLSLRDFDPDLHPRGRDGQFIEKFGTVKLFDIDARDSQGNIHPLDGRRAIVTGITPNPRTPGEPDIKFRVLDNSGAPSGKELIGKPDNVEQAQEKGRIRQALDRQLERKAVADDAIAQHVENVGKARERAGVPPERPPWSRQAPPAMTLAEMRELAPAAMMDEPHNYSPEPPPDTKPTRYMQFDDREKTLGWATEWNRENKPKTDDVAAIDNVTVHSNGWRKARDVDELQVLHDNLVAARDEGGLDQRQAVDVDRAIEVLEADLARRQPREELESQIPTDVSEEDALLLDELRARVHGFAERIRRGNELATERWRYPGADQPPPQKSIEEQRAEFLADLNAKLATVSTTDAELRYEQLDAILAPARFSPIDTNRLYSDGRGRYTPERHAQHKEMLNKLLEDVAAADVPIERDSLALGGLPGAGKTFALGPGQKAEQFGIVSWEYNGVKPPPPGVTHISINPDAVKEMMVERGMLTPGIVGLKPMEQATFLHEESSYLSNVFSRKLSGLGYNLVLDNTMDSRDKMADRMVPLAKNGYMFRGLFADITPEESIESVTNRYLRSALTPEGGRFVPSSVNNPEHRRSTKGNMSKNRDAFDDLVEDDWFTEWMWIDNTGVSEDPPNPIGTTGQGTGSGSAAAAWAVKREPIAEEPAFPVPESPEPGGNREIPGVGNVDEYLAANPQEPNEAYFEWQSRIVDGLPDESKHALLFETRERYEPVPYIAEAMTRWRAEHGRPEPTVNIAEIPAPLEKANLVARTYEQAADQADDPRVQQAFFEFKRQNAEMWDFMTKPESEGGLGITIDFTPLEQGDPYPDATSQADDLRNNRHMTTQSGLGGAHELTMTQEEYDRFRAVHDVFGHAGIGGGFDRHGEYQAYLVHSSMYDGDGRRAMASEYHGVNTAAWAGEPGTPGTGKSILLPEELILDPFSPTGEIIAASATPEIPDETQLEMLGIDEAHAEGLAYLATQAGITPPFGQWYDSSPMHYHTPPEGTDSYEA